MKTQKIKTSFDDRYLVDFIFLILFPFLRLRKSLGLFNKSSL